MNGSETHGTRSWSLLVLVQFLYFVKVLRRWQGKRCGRHGRRPNAGLLLRRHSLFPFGLHLSIGGPLRHLHVGTY